MVNINREQIEIFNNNFHIERHFTQKQNFLLEFKQTILQDIADVKLIQNENENAIENDKPTYHVYDKKTQDCVLKDANQSDINDFIKNKMDRYLKWQPDIIKFNENFLIDIEEIKRFRGTLKKVNYRILRENYAIDEFERDYLKDHPYETQNCEDILVGYVIDKRTKEKVLKFNDVWELIDFIQSNSNDEKGNE